MKKHEWIKLCRDNKIDSKLADEFIEKCCIFPLTDYSAKSITQAVLSFKNNILLARRQS